MEGIPESLVQFFKDNPKPALAFSGGVDSTYLMYVCRRLDVDLIPVFFMGEFQTVADLVNVENLCKRYNFNPEFIEVNVMAYKDLTENGENRCYLCKKLMFIKMWERVKQFDRNYMMDGTNASDSPEERPGMKALEELGVRSPLRECGLTKEDVRRLSREAGLNTWDQPSNSCLATRIPHGMKITRDLLMRTNMAETDLRAFGLKDIRLRTTMDGNALLEVLPSQQDFLEEHKEEIERMVLDYYPGVSYGTRKVA